ncbi:MAG: hypothetical protein ACPLSN_06800 [Dictyoglomus turgidum]
MSNDYFISWRDLEEQTGIPVCDLKKLILEDEVVCVKDKRYIRRGDKFYSTRRKNSIYVIKDPE